MTYTRFAAYDPFAGLLDLQDRLERLLGNPSPGWALGPARPSVFPPINAFTDAEGMLVVRAEVPGIEPESVHVTIERGTLTVSGERKRPEPAKASWHRRERTFGKFSRSVTLPNDVDADKATARCVNGVLEVRLPKSAAAQPRSINIARS